MIALSRRVTTLLWTYWRCVVSEKAGEVLPAPCLPSDMLLGPHFQMQERNEHFWRSATLEVQGSEIRCEQLFKGLASRTEIDLFWMVQGEEAASMGTVKRKM